MISMTRRTSLLFLLLIVLGAAFLIFFGINTGLPSLTRLEVELGGGSAIDAAQPGLLAFLNGNKQDRTEFLAYGERDELAALSPYFDQLRSYHPDEQYILKVIAGMVKKRDIQPRNYIYPPFFFYQVGAGLGVANACGLLPDKAIKELDFIHRPDQMASIYLAARCTIAFLALAGIVLMFICGRRLFNSPEAGLTAALLLAAVPLYALAGKFIKPDIPCVLWTMVALFFSLRAYRDGRWINYLAAGVAVGLAAGSKYPGVLSALLPAGYWLARHWKHPGETWTAVWNKSTAKTEFMALCGSGVACIAAFFAVNPSALLDSVTFRHDFEWISHVLRESHFWPDLGEFTFCLLSDGIFYHTGLLLMPLLVAGFIYALVRPRRELLPLLPVIVVYLIMGSRGRPGSDAYMLPALPLLCLLTVALLRAIPARAWRYGLLASAVLSGIAYSLAISQCAAGENIRLTASRWLQQQLPPGTSLARSQYPVGYRTAMTPPQRYPAPALLTNPKAADATWFLASSFEWETGFSPWKVRLTSAVIPPAPAPGYQLVKVFSEPPLVFGFIPMRARGYVASPYLDVIFPVIAVYQKKGSELQHVQR